MSLSCHNASENVHYPRGTGRFNVNNLIYDPHTARNASAEPSDFVCSNHVPMNQSDTVSTEVVGSVGRPLCAAPPALIKIT